MAASKYLQHKYRREWHTPRLGIKVWVNLEAKAGYVLSLQREKSLPIPALLIDLLKIEIYHTGTVCTNPKGFPKV